MIGVLAFGLLEGLVIAALLGLITLLIGTKQRSTSVLGKEPETDVYRSVEHFPEAETYPACALTVRCILPMHMTSRRPCAG
jgi:hypothetical protein